VKPCEIVREILCRIKKKVHFLINILTFYYDRMLSIFDVTRKSANGGGFQGVLDSL